MGIFARRQQADPEPPVRHEQVMKVLQAALEEQDAQESPQWPAALAKFHAVCAESTQAELRAAFAAEKRAPLLSSLEGEF
jgi:hypothetical protein